jgi:hypothetical protein
LRQQSSDKLHQLQELRQKHNQCSSRFTSATQNEENQLKKIPFTSLVKILNRFIRKFKMSKNEARKKLQDANEEMTNTRSNHDVYLMLNQQTPIDIH